MLYDIKSPKILKDICGLLKFKYLLKLITYNKLIQSKFSIDINSYKKEADIYRLIEKNGKCKEYKNRADLLLFEGEWNNGKRNGHGKEYSHGKLIFEGEFKDGKKNGPGKVYREDELIFEGIFKNGEEWEGKGEKKCSDYYYNGIISEGKLNGEGRLYKELGKLEYEGNFINNKKSGYGKEYMKEISLMIKRMEKEKNMKMEKLNLKVII